MNAIRLNRNAVSLHRILIGYTALAVAVFGFIGALPSSARAETLQDASASTPIALTQAAQDMRADYRQQQWQRLAQKSDRDSLIAAVLLGMPEEADKAPINGNADVEQHLAKVFGHDPLALFTLALACQMQSQPCAHPEHYDALVRIAPDNAVHWLLLPNDGTPSDAQLHAAAAATHADTHLRDIMRIVRTALANQPPPALRTGVDPRELALLLRRNAVDQVQIPKFRGAITACKGAVEQLRTDCIGLGRNLQNDRSGAFISRMIGVVLIRRLEKDTPEDVAAKEMRRDYVWVSDQLLASKAPYEERVQNETVVFGENEAWQRAVERLGEPRTPPAGWMPKDPQVLLMSEERTPVSPAK
jgi:hypothetical protein